MGKNDENNTEGKTSKNKTLRFVAIALSLIEALFIAVFFAVFGYDGVVRYMRMATPPPIEYEYQGEAVFDFDIKGEDGVDYPAGTVFEVYGFTRWENIMMKSESGSKVSGHHSDIDICQAKNSDELLKAFEQLTSIETAKQNRQNITVVVISAIACVIAFFVFAFINNKWSDQPVKQAILCIVIVALSVFNSLFIHRYMSKARAPVIYLYPEQKTEVNVKLVLNGKLTTTYPLYDNDLGWNVTATPEGIITDSKGREYSYLFWEGDIAITPDLSSGFCIKGEDTAAFLEKSLKQLGLTDIEADAFIMYWLPLMEENKYNVITFQTAAYKDVSGLKIDPKPDTVIRVNMLWYPVNTYVDMKPQDLDVINPSERKGF
ncbi:MAG: hypothetical protein V3G41_12175, partial [Lachnospiraceae bacterium]